MAIIYLDESGDLGWSFNAPYRKGGSSRYLTIAAVLVSNNKKHLPKRIIKNLYRRLNVSAGDELKWVHVDENSRLWIASEMAKLKQKLNSDLVMLSMTVEKQKVMQHIRNDSNKLYNYMVNLLLSKEMAKHPVVTLIPDQRSIKVSSGDSMHDYLQTQLWFELNAATQLTTSPQDSSRNSGLQFADMLAGIVQSHFEDRRSSCVSILTGHVEIKKLYF